MKRKLNYFGKGFILVLTFICLECSLVWAQTARKDDSIPLPSEESFKLIDGIVNDAGITSERKFADVREEETVLIYNADGSVWYEFSPHINNPLHYRKNPKSEFKPFCYGDWFRIKGISKNWYEVVINEETEETKYILISDPITNYVPFEYYILKNGAIGYDKEKNPIRETPDGKVLKVLYDDGTAFPQKIEGDWLCVMADRERNCKGWIRWKKERKLLIGFSLNERIVPEQ